MRELCKAGSFIQSHVRLNADQSMFSSGSMEQGCSCSVLNADEVEPVKSLPNDCGVDLIVVGQHFCDSRR